MMNFILFGSPGSGKGTQSEKLIKKYGLVHLATGNLLRQEIEDRTPLGLKVKSFIDTGQLVPDEVVIGMISTCLDEHTDAKGFLFDGFPRTVAQAHALDKLLALKKTEIDMLLALEVSEDELVKRLMNRGKTLGRSDDIDEIIIRNRFSVYKKETTLVADHYKKLNKLIYIKGEGTVDEIFEAICKVIDTFIH